MCSSMNDSIDNGLKAFGDLVLPMSEIESAMGHFASGLSSKYCDERVICLSVLSHLKATCPNFTKFLYNVHVTCGCGSLILR